MKILKLLLVLGLLFKTIDADEIETISETDEKVSFSVSAIWLSYHKKETTCPAKWAKGVQEFYDGVRNAVDDVFKSSEARKMGDCAVTSLGKYLKKLVSLTHNNSTLVTSCVTSILTSLSTLKDLNESGLKIIIEFDKALPAVLNNYNKIARSLSAYIGDLTSAFTDDVTDVGNEFSKFQKEFIRSCRLFKCQKEVDFTPVQKKVQKLSNTLALINETLLKKCERASQETHEAVLILDLMYVHLHIAVTGINSCALDEKYRNECHVSKDFKSVSHSFETALIQITEAVCAITFPLANSIKGLLYLFVNIVLALNEAVKSFFGVVEGLTVTVGEITQNLLQGLELSPSLAKDKTNILKGLTRN